MSQNAEVQAEVQAKVSMLPPSSAVYVQGAIAVPVFVKPPADPGEPPTVFVAPVLLAGNIRRVHWSLVLLSGKPEETVEFVPHHGIQLTQVSDPNKVGGMPEVGLIQDLSTTQVAWSFKTSAAGLGIARYVLNFHLLKVKSSRKLGPVIQAIIRADPSVGVTPDPVDIPTWP